MGLGASYRTDAPHPERLSPIPLDPTLTIDMQYSTQSEQLDLAIIIDLEKEKQLRMK